MCVLAKEQVYVAKNTRKRAKKSFLCVLLVDRSRDLQREAFGVLYHPSLPEPAKTEIVQQLPESCSPDTDSRGGALV